MQADVGFLHHFFRRRVLNTLAEVADSVRRRPEPESAGTKTRPA